MEKEKRRTGKEMKREKDEEWHNYDTERSGQVSGIVFKVQEKYWTKRNQQEEGKCRNQ